uniref:Protein asunder n=1 Tax=Heterorhabditis bacteriophora TaxID=37862 RepID=A0A1I7WMS2_HETBA
MSLGADHKLLIVLDHGSKFAKDANSPIPISLKDSTSTEMRQVGVAQKTLWTWCVECAMELHRVVSDLFPTQNRLIRLVLADCVGRLLQSEWGTQLITHHQEFLIKVLAEFHLDIGKMLRKLVSTKNRTEDL